MHSLWECATYNINITCTRYVHGSAIKFHTQVVVPQVRCAKSTIPRTMSDIRVLVLLLFVCIFQGPRFTPNTGVCVCVCVCVCVYVCVCVCVCLCVFAYLHLCPRFRDQISHTRSLRSSSQNLLSTKNTRTKTFGARMFSCAAPLLWNALPSKLRSQENTDLFKSQLKTYLFNNAYKVFSANRECGVHMWDCLLGLGLGLSY